MQQTETKNQIKSILHHETGKLWHHFRTLNAHSAILHGSCSTNHTRFKLRSRGKQGTACSVVAIVFGRLFEPKDWTRYLVDQVLEFGDKLFCISQIRNKVNPEQYMTVSLIYPEFFIGDYKCMICAEEGAVYGNLFSKSIGCPDFSDGLQRFFRTNDAGVVTTQGMSVAMWRQPGGGFFYFDSSSCAENGIRCANGMACLMRFKCMNEMRELFLSNVDKKFDSRYCIAKVGILRVRPLNRRAYQPSQTLTEFAGEADVTKRPELIVDRRILRTINPMAVEEGKFDCARPTRTEPKLLGLMKVQKEPLSITISNYSIDTWFSTKPFVDQNNFDTGYQYYDMHVNVPSMFKELPGDMAILHGWTHEGGEMYKGKGAQNVANCVMAIGMKKVYATKTWLRPRLDEILALGDVVYADVKADKPSIKSMTAADFNDVKFQIEGRKFIVDVDLITIIGTICSKVPSVLNLKQALEEFFLVNTDGIIECSSMAVALWTQDDYYYTFDPRQCGPLGVHIVEDKGKTGKGGGTGGKKETDAKEKKAKGKCCVIRFPDFSSLVALFLKNIDPGKRNDHFTVRRITIIDDVPGTRPWNDFAPVDVGKWILRGTIANDDDEFEDESRGVQGPAIPSVALVYAKEVSPVKWTKETVDEAIRDGDAYFNWSISAEEELTKDVLMTDMKKDFYLKNKKIKVDYEECSVVGDLKAPPDGEQLNLVGGISEFFESHQYGVLQVKNLFVAIWKFEEELKNKTKEIAYYCFDPNPRGKLGQRNPEGEEEGPVGCLVRTLNITQMAKIIEDNIHSDVESHDNEFMIHDFKVLSIGQSMTDEELEKDKEVPVKPELNFYTTMGDDGACLNGSFNQGDEVMFKHHTRDKQQAANALVTLAMTKLYNSHLWYREIVDEILKIGDKVTADNAENIPEPEEDEENVRDYLLPNEIGEQFNIGVNQITVGLEEDAVTGKLSDLTKSLEEFFENNTHGLFRYRNVMMPIWKNGNIFFLMDPKGRDNRGAPKDKDGTATVMWFTNIAALVGSLQMSIEKTDGEFSLDGVDIDNVYETRLAEGERLPRATSTEDLWYNFPKRSNGVWGFNGHVSLADEKFAEDNRNKQSAAVAVMAIIFSKVYQPRNWKAEILDEVVITGDKLHSICVARLGEGTVPRVVEIITEFFLSNRRIGLTVKDCVQAGDLCGKPPKLQDLQMGIDNFFKSYASGTLYSCNVNIAIWKYNNFYYCVIPGSSVGDGDSFGTPQILRFSNTKLLVDSLLFNLGKEGDYEIAAVDVVDWDKLPPWKHDPSPAICPSNLPPLNAFQRLQGARAILHGSTHQSSDIFPQTIRNKQTAANCVAILGMSVVKSPITWTRKTLDEVLVIGNNIYQETTKANPMKEKLKPKDIIRVFYVGVNVLTADVEENTVSGQVAIPPPEPEVKDKGKKGTKKKATTGKDKKGKGKTKRPVPPLSPPILLEEGIRKFFEGNYAGILVTGRYMTAIWKNYGVFFMYDPRACNGRGMHDEFGSACVMWFACLEPMYDLIFANIDEKEKYGLYDICRVIVKTVVIEPLPCPVGFRPVEDSTTLSIPVSPIKKMQAMLNVETVSEYYSVDNELSVLRGSYHMNDRQFNVKSRGFQSTAIAAVAIVVGSLHVPSMWTSELVNAILKYGDLLHVDSTRTARPGARNLSPSELLTVFVIGDIRASVYIHNHTGAGILRAHDLIEGLGLFFKSNCAGILHMTNMSVAVMQHYGNFYLFDPCSRDKLGRPSHDGAACVMKCESISKLAQTFVTNCNYKVPTIYTLNAVNILGLHFFSDAKSECSPICLK